MSWKDLNITQKAELIKLGIRSGIKDINQIRQLYDNVDIKDYQHPYYTNKTVPKDNIQSQNQDNTLIKGMIDDFNRNKHNIPQQNIYSQNNLDTERIDNQNQAQFQQFKGGGYISNNSSMSLVGEVRKYKEGGYEDEDENTIYTAGYSEPINVKASRKLSKRQQMQADEEWRKYLAKHPIQIGSEEYNRLPEKARAQVVKNSVTNAINKAALPTAAAIIAPTALTAGAASLVGSGALTAVADTAGKVGTKIASTGIGQAAKNFVTNPYVDYALTIDGMMHIPSYIRNGVDKVKNKEYLNALGDFSLAALEGFGMANMPNNVSKIHDDIYNVVNNYPELIEKGKNYFNRVTAPITSIKHTPYTGDHLALAKERMINGGFDKLGIDDYLEITVPKSNPLHKLGDFQESNSNYELLKDIEKTEFNAMKDLLEQRLKYDVNTRKYLMNMEPLKDPTNPLIQEGNSFYTRREKQIYTPMVGKYAQFNREIPHIVDAHEWQHTVDDLGNVGHNYSKEEMDLLNESIDLSRIESNARDYLRNYTEQHARLAQIKNYFGITDPNAPVTEDMWNYARRHYVKDTGMDNNMQQFFRAVKDPKTYLRIMNGKVAGATGVGLLGLKALQQDNNKEYSNGGFLFPNQSFSHKFGGGGFPDGNPTQTQNDSDKKVSKTYFENFPNLLEVYGTPRYNGEEKEMIENGDITGAQESRNLRGEERVKEVKSLLNNLTQQDSMFYTPILQRVDNIFEKTYNPDEEVSTMHRVSEGKVLSSLKDALQYYPVEEFKKKHQYILNKLQEVSDEDIYKFMTTNWGMDTVQDIMNIKPKNLSLAELLIIATTIQGMKSSYALFKHKHGGYIFPKGVFQHKFAEGGNPDGEDVVLIEPDTTTDALNIDTSRYDRNYQIDIDSVPKVNSLDEILNAKPEYVVPKGNAENTYADKVNEHNNKNSSRDREARLESLKSKSEQEIKEIQRSYADQGFYDFELKTGKSKEARDIQRRLAKEEYISYKDVDGNIGYFTTKALQQMLIEKGYLPEFNEYGRPNKDGIIGKRTREAFKQYNRDYNVDGIAGALTENIYLQGNKQTIVSAEGMQDQCAKWVSKQFETNIGNTKQNGVFGNAWNMLYNIKDQGGEILFNLYEDPAFDSVTTGRGVINNVNRLLQSTDMNSLYSQLQVNDVVGIHMPSSTHFKDVLNGGTTYNTHVGIVTGFKNGVPIISHNIGGKVRTEPINNLTGSTWGKPSVTVASRPKNSSNVAQELVFDNNIKSTLHVPEGKENDLMSEYMDSLAQSKQTFKDIYTGVDMDFIEKASIGITGVETNFMNTKQSDLRKKGNPQALLRSAAHWVKQTNEEVKSQDLTKMKFNTLSSEYRKSIGLTSPEQLSEDPTVTGRAVFLTLCKYYDYFQRLAKENPKLGLTKQDIENATILSYNRGFASTHTLGFDRQGFGTPEELEYLRKAGEIGSREKDISSTNYKYLGDLGEKLYNKAFPEGSLTYVGRVRGYMEKI